MEYFSIFYRIFIIFFLVRTSFSQSSTMKNFYDYCHNDHLTTEGFTNDCGNGVIMKYPFWRMDYKELHHRQYFCGYPGFGITCDHLYGYPVINISNQSYYVTRASSNDNYIHIVEPDFIQKTCPRPRHNFSSHSVIPLEAHSSFHLTIFFNCTSPPPPLMFTDLYNQSHDLECLAYNNTMRSYGFFNYNGVTESDWKLLAGWNGNYCREQSVVVPFGSIASTDSINYLETLERGFTVGWVTPIECQQCESSGGFCLYNETESTYTCTPPPNASSTWMQHHKILIIGVFSGFGGLVLIMILLFFFYRNNQNKRLGSIAKKLEDLQMPPNPSGDHFLHPPPTS